MNMKYVVVGLGSMGKRRIRLLKQVRPEARIMGVDSKEDRRDVASKEYQIEVATSLEEALECGDIVFVSTSPLSHSNIINQALRTGCHVFTELNLVQQGYEENIALAKEKNCVLFLSSTFLYRKELQHLRENVNSHDNAYVYHVGQYLPDWHPWESYKDFFVADKRTNGCRELLAIELPWLCECFGDVVSYHVVKSKKSKLDLPYPDTYQIILEHENGNSGVLCVDLLARKAIRSLEVLHEDYHYFWKGTPDSFTKYDVESKQLVNISCYEAYENDPRYSENIVENAYMDEIIAYLDEIENGIKALYSFEKDQKILDLIDHLEEE